MIRWKIIEFLCIYSMNIYNEPCIISVLISMQQVQIKYSRLY